MDEAHNDMLVAFRFEPQKEEVLNELSTVEQLCRFKVNPTLLEIDVSEGKEAFGPLQFHTHSTETPSTSYTHAYRNPIRSIYELFG